MFIQLDSIQRMRFDTHLREAIQSGNYNHIYLLDPNRFWSHLNEYAIKTHIGESKLIPITRINTRTLDIDPYSVKDAVIIIDGYDAFTNQLLLNRDPFQSRQFELLTTLSQQQNTLILAIK